MAQALANAGWDVLAWNFRGCSGEPNRLMRAYHSGATDDLGAVVEHGVRSGAYSAAGVLGFSLGGNLTLKYLGELAGGPGRVVTFGQR
jgi:predicted alpha/beta-fold hydrolase